MGSLRHLAKEVQEVLTDPTDLEEYADCFFLTLDATRRAGFTQDQFKTAVWAKLEKNKSRQWTKLNPSNVDEPLEHVR